MKKLYRSTENKKIAGIFGGLGEIFNIDPTLLRLIFVFIGLVTAVIPLVLAWTTLLGVRWSRSTVLLAAGFLSALAVYALWWLIFRVGKE